MNKADLGELWSSLCRQSTFRRLLIAGLLGLLLLLVSGSLPKAEPAEPGEGKASLCFDEISYTRQLEEQLTALIGSLAGAGRTRVMVTLEEGEGYEYVSDQKTDEARQSRETEHVLRSSGRGTEPLLQSTYMPTVRGVAVLCEGGSNPAVVGKITEAVSVLLDLGTNRISVAKIKS